MGWAGTYPRQELGVHPGHVASQLKFTVFYILNDFDLTATYFLSIPFVAITILKKALNRHYTLVACYDKACNFCDQQDIAFFIVHVELGCFGLNILFINPVTIQIYANSFISTQGQF